MRLRSRSSSRPRRAVASIQGVLLLVAVAILLGVVVVVTGIVFTDMLRDPTPEASIRTQEVANTVVFTHLGGETIEGDNLAIDGGTPISVPDEFQAGSQIQVVPLQREIELLFEEQGNSAILKREVVSETGPGIILLGEQPATEGTSYNGTYPEYVNIVDEPLTFRISEGNAIVSFELDPGERRQLVGNGTSDSGTIAAIDSDDQRTVSISVDPA